MNESQTMSMLREAVNAAGAKWIGVQQSLDPFRIGGEYLLLFLHPETNSSLSVKFNPISFEFETILSAVKEKLAADKLTFSNQKISVRAERLEGIRQRVSGIESELREILGEKSGKINP